jgi:hypothetical protein
LRWLGNWGPILAQRRDRAEGNEFLWGHIQATATAIALEVETLLTDRAHSDDELLVRAVNAATRIQDQAQNLVALSQVHYAFQPRTEEDVLQPGAKTGVGRSFTCSGSRKLSKSVRQ